MLPQSIEKNMYLRHGQGKINILWCKKIQFIYDFLLKSRYSDTNNIEKNMSYGRNEAKSRYCDAQKIHNFYDFLVKSQYFDAQKY